jgi:hypothetical protein
MAEEVELPCQGNEEGADDDIIISISKGRCSSLLHALPSWYHSDFFRDGAGS